MRREASITAEQYRSDHAIPAAESQPLITHKAVLRQPFNTDKASESQPLSAHKAAEYRHAKTPIAAEHPLAKTPKTAEHPLTNTPKTAESRLAFVAIIIVLILTTAILFFGMAPYFSISEIEVSGNSYYDAGHIIAKSGIRAGQNGFTALKGNNVIKLLSFRCGDAEQAVAAACPYVKSINIRYVMPAAIRVEIVERSKSVILPYFGIGLLIDGEGVAVDIVRDFNQYDLPVATGVSITHYEIGKAISVSDDRRIETVLLVVSALRQVDRDSDDTLSWQITSIDVSDLRNIYLYMNNGINVNLGDGTELYYRVSAVKEILTHGISEGETGEIIFSNGARPVFVPSAI